MLVMADALHENITWSFHHVHEMKTPSRDESADKRISPPRSISNNTDSINKSVKKKCILLDCNNSGEIVAEGKLFSSNPEDKVHNAPLGPNASKVWVEVVKVGDAKVWRRSPEFETMADTLVTLLEWAMTELLRHPESLKRLQEEVRTICKGKYSVSEDDLQEMKYLKAVIKEALRLHPPFPMMAPHESTQDVQLRDYHIPAGTQVMMNAWAIGREVATWGPDAEEFKPERHLDTSVDFRGQNFELLPFGAGRRICPAVSFAVVLNEVVLANLVHGFDWKLPEGSIEDKTDVVESSGFSVHREFPLYAIASPTT